MISRAIHRAYGNTFRTWPHAGKFERNCLVVVVPVGFRAEQRGARRYRRSSRGRVSDPPDTEAAAPRIALSGDPLSFIDSLLGRSSLACGVPAVDHEFSSGDIRRLI